MPVKTYSFTIHGGKYMSGIGALIYIIVFYTFLIILFAGSWILATIISNYLGLNGLNWWLVSIVLTLIIFSLIDRTSKITRKE